MKKRYCQGCGTELILEKDNEYIKCPSCSLEWIIKSDGSMMNCEDNYSSASVALVKKFDSPMIVEFFCTNCSQTFKLKTNKNKVYCIYCDFEIKGGKTIEASRNPIVSYSIEDLNLIEVTITELELRKKKFSELKRKEWLQTIIILPFMYGGFGLIWCGRQPVIGIVLVVISLVVSMSFSAVVQRNDRYLKKDRVRGKKLLQQLIEETEEEIFKLKKKASEINDTL